MTIEKREIDFRHKLALMIGFPADMRSEFADYWTEPNKSRTKMRFELEKTWDLKRRLQRWQMNNDSRKSFNGHPAPVKKVEVMSENKQVAELDRILAAYKLHPTDIPFADLGKFYPFMKSEKLLKPMTRGEIDTLIQVYNGDNEKCRCACVQETFNGYVNSGFTFSHVFELRNRLEAK